MIEFNKKNYPQIFAFIEHNVEPVPTPCPPEFKPGSFGAHEALHMAHFLADSIERYLVEHPTISSDERYCRLACNAADVLIELYTVLGEDHLDDTRTPKDWKHGEHRTIFKDNLKE